MSLIFTDTAAATKTLDANFKIKGFPFKKRSSMVTLAYRDGGRNVSDNKIDPRVIQIEGIVRAASAAAYETAIQDYYVWLNKLDLKLAWTAGKYINVREITDITPQFVDGGFLRICKLSFNCQCEDPFVYYDALTSDVKVIAASPTTWVIANAGSYEEFPVIEIVNAANNPNVIVENTTDNTRFFTYDDANFLNTDTLAVDNKEGTVEKNGANNIDKFGGSFLRLLVGNNTIKYTGAACTMTTKWYKKEL
jgi:phage-related protein